MLQWLAHSRLGFRKEPIEQSRHVTITSGLEIVDNEGEEAISIVPARAGIYAIK